NAHQPGAAQSLGVFGRRGPGRVTGVAFTVVSERVQCFNFRHDDSPAGSGAEAPLLGYGVTSGSTGRPSKSPLTKASGRYTARPTRSSQRMVTMFFTKLSRSSVDTVTDTSSRSQPCAPCWKLPTR